MMQIELLKAISRGDSLQWVIDILDANPTAIHQYDGRPTPLMSAAKYGRKSVVRHLIAAQCSIDDIDKDRKTALSIASNYGHVDVISSLLDAGANIDHQDIHGMTPLMICAQSGRVPSVQLLLLRGANRDIKRTADSKRAIDLTSSTELRVILSLNNNNPKYSALFTNGDVTPLGSGLFEFPSGRLTCIQCVNISMSSGMVENIPCLSRDASELNRTHVISLSSDSCGNDKNGIMLNCANLVGDDTVDGICSNSSSSYSYSNSNSNSNSNSMTSHQNSILLNLPPEGEGRSPATIPVILKLSTNSENIRKEVEMLQKFQNIFRVGVSPFIRLADNNSGIIHFEKVDTGDVIHDKSNNSGNSGNASIRDEVNVNTAEGNRDRNIILKETNIDMFDTKNRTVNVEKPETSNSAKWTGFLIEKGFCDLHKLGIEFLAININDTRSRSTCSVSHRFVKNKIPRTSYVDDFKLDVSDDVCANNINEVGPSSDHDNNYEDNGKWISTSNKTSKRFEGEKTAHDLQSLFHNDLDKLNIIFNFAVQICGCVAVLHDMGYVWLDLKPANFVIFVKNNFTEREFENKNKKENENENKNKSTNENKNGKREKEYNNYSNTNINENSTTTEILNKKDNDKQEKFKWNFSETFPPDSGFSFVIKAIDLGGCSVVNTTHDLCTLTFTAKFMAPELAQLIILKNDDTSDMKRVSTNIVRDVDEGNEDRSKGNHEYKTDKNANHDIDNDYHHHNNDNNVNKTDPSNPRQRIEYTISTAYDSWSLGMCLLQLFHKNFECFFSDMKKEIKNENEIENENDGDKKCSQKSKNSDLVLQKLADFGHLLQIEIDKYLSKFVCIEDSVTENWNNSDDDNNVRNDNYHDSDRNAICYDDDDDDDGDDDDKKCGINSSDNKCNKFNECTDSDNLSNNQKARNSNLDHTVINEKNAQKFKKNVLDVIRKLLRVIPSERISVKEAHSMMTSSSIFIQ